MTIDERLEALRPTVELLASKHRDNGSATTQFEAAMTRLTQGVIDSVSRLTRILETRRIVLD
jgi:hypothetical protein